MTAVRRVFAINKETKMKKLSQNLQKMPRSGIRVILDLAMRQKQAFHLELGEPGFATPVHIRQAAIQAMEEGFTKYTPNPGLASLRETILQKARNGNGIKAQLEQVAVTPGSVFALAAAMITVADAGDEILIPDPGWPNYNMQALILGLKPVLYSLRPENGYQPVVDEIQTLIGPRTRAIIINSPSNPTGAVFSKKTIQAMVDLARRHDIYLISDEAYEAIIYEGRHYSPAAFDPDDRVITVNAVSKTYAMTGWRIGYYIAPAQIATDMHKVIEPFVVNATAISQKAAEAALNGPQDCVREMTAAYKQRRDMVVEVLQQEGFEFVVPQGAFYLLVEIAKTGMDSYDFAQELVQKTGVAVAPGKTFGPSADSYIRISFCADPEELQEGLRRFSQFCHDQYRHA
jgi:aspartate aminotransferase/aminotransferase